MLALKLSGIQNVRYINEMKQNVMTSIILYIWLNNKKKDKSKKIVRSNLCYQLLLFFLCNNGVQKLLVFIKFFCQFNLHLVAVI